MSEEKSPIIIGSDHAGFQMKESVKTYLKKVGIKYEDIGPDDEESVDYPVYGIKVSRAVSKGEFERGILICGTGIGMSMVANRFPRVRAALCNHIFSTLMSRQHNDSNLLVMGGRVIGESLAHEIVKTWLETPFEGGRHQNRLGLFDEVEV